MEKKERKTNKKKTLLILALVLLIGCGVGAWAVWGRPAAAPEKPEAPAPVVAALPKTTSKQARLYVADQDGKLTVVDFDGEAVMGYTVSKDGHITDGKGKVLVAKANVERYVFVSEIVCGAEKVELTEGDAPVALELTVKPENATNPALQVSVADGKIATVTDGKVAAVAAGETTLTATAGDVELKIPVTVAKAEDKTETPEPTPAPAPDPEPAPAPTPAPAPAPSQPTHVHSYSASTVAPTCESGGYTTHTCSCGDSYTDSYTAALGHDWETVYEEKTVEVTQMVEHEVCKGCGMYLEDLSSEDLYAHASRHMQNGEQSGWYSEWNDEVVGTETEQVLVGYKCSRCGANKAA